MFDDDDYELFLTAKTKTVYNVRLKHQYCQYVYGVMC